MKSCLISSVVKRRKQWQVNRGNDKKKWEKWGNWLKFLISIFKNLLWIEKLFKIFEAKTFFFWSMQILRSFNKKAFWELSWIQNLSDNLRKFKSFLKIWTSLHFFNLLISSQAHCELEYVQKLIDYINRFKNSLKVLTSSNMSEFKSLRKASLCFELK